MIDLPFSYRNSTQTDLSILVTVPPRQPPAAFRFPAFHFPDHPPGPQTPTVRREPGASMWRRRDPSSQASWPLVRPIRPPAPGSEVPANNPAGTARQHPVRAWRRCIYPVRSESPPDCCVPSPDRSLTATASLPPPFVLADEKLTLLPCCYERVRSVEISSKLRRTPWPHLHDVLVATNYTPGCYGAARCKGQSSGPADGLIRRS